MTHDFADDVPAVLREVVTRPLFVMRLNVKPLQVVGATPGLFRRIGVVPGGTFFGARLAGEVLEGGADWQTVRGDGTTTLDVRLALKTKDGELIAMSYRGLRQGARDTLERIDRGEAVDPAAYYFRIAPVFETASREHAWLNDILAVGLGYRYAGGVMYSVFEVR
jgi:hypothetical protein